jgi:hypothetical protein
MDFQEMPPQRMAEVRRRGGRERKGRITPHPLSLPFSLSLFQFAQLESLRQLCGWNDIEMKSLSDITRYVTRFLLSGTLLPTLLNETMLSIEVRIVLLFLPSSSSSLFILLFSFFSFHSVQLLVRHFGWPWLFFVFDENVVPALKRIYSSNGTKPAWVVSFFEMLERSVSLYGADERMETESIELTVLTLQQLLQSTRDDNSKLVLRISHHNLTTNKTISIFFLTDVDIYWRTIATLQTIIDDKKRKRRKRV